MRIQFTDPVTGLDLEYNGEGGEISFPLLLSHDVILYYGNEHMQLLLAPGDTLIITDAGFTGRHALANELLRRYRQTFYGKDLYARSRQLNLYIPDGSVDACKTFLQNRFEKENKMLERFIAQQEPDTLFSKWAQYSLWYEYGGELLRYASLNGPEKIPVSYYDFLEKFPVNNPDAAVSSRYISYMDEYSNYTLAQVLNTGRNYITYCDSLPPGLSRDMLLCRYAAALLSAELGFMLSPDIKRFEKMVTNDMFRKTILRQYHQQIHERESFTIPEDSHLNTPVESSLQQFIAPFTGKVIYIDIWATWCEPCRRAMPASRQLHNGMAKDDIVFLYLCVQSEAQAWRSVIAKLNIGGEHFLLNEAQYRQLKQAYRIGGIPHYLIVDRNGSVVDKNAMGPGEAGIKAKLTELLRSQNKY